MRAQAPAHREKGALHTPWDSSDVRCHLPEAQIPLYPSQEQLPRALSLFPFLSGLWWPRSRFQDEEKSLWAMGVFSAL